MSLRAILFEGRRRQLGCAVTPFGREASAGSRGLGGFVYKADDELGDLHYYCCYDTEVETTGQIVGGLHP